MWQRATVIIKSAIVELVRQGGYESHFEAEGIKNGEEGMRTGRVVAMRQKNHNRAGETGPRRLGQDALATYAQRVRSHGSAAG